MAQTALRDGNTVRLLENGEVYFPRVYGAIGRAEREILLETFILNDDGVGRRLRSALLQAAARGVGIDLTLDGYGCADLSEAFLRPMIEDGIRVHVYDPQPRMFSMRINLFRRMHRKLMVVDGAIGFVSGLNYSHDHLRDLGPGSKQDYGVEIRGPVVGDIRRAMLAVLPVRPGAPGSDAVAGEPPAGFAPGAMAAGLVLRDNQRHRKDIERAYVRALRSARHTVVIANAYFLPGFRLLRAIRQAARRGVTVRLIAQGRLSDKPVVRYLTGILYEQLLRAGVRVYEYCERPFHGKVATVDGLWATVGSSNLDPLSLFLNLEANLVVVDAGFAARLQERLERLCHHRCREVRLEQAASRTLWREAVAFLLFHALRRFPAWAGWMPGHTRARSANLSLRSAERSR